MVTKTGHIDPDGPDFIYVPFDVPEGVTELRFSYDYTDKPDTALDILVFDSNGYGPGNQAGFRGSSGGGRAEFVIAGNWATPGYRPGAIEPGTWHVGLGPYRIASGGTDWTVTVRMTGGAPGQPFVCHPAPTHLNDTPGWYRGDTHVHSIHSGDSDYRPEDIVRDAKARGLDFFVSTEHHTVSNHCVWGAYPRPDLLIINGEEVTTRHGHFNCIGLSTGSWIDYRYRPQDGVFSRVVREVHRDGAIVSANHPFQTCKGCSWEFGYDGVDAVEVWNGPWTEDDEEALRLWDAMLRQGRFLTGIGSSDVHSPSGPNYIGTARTVVRATGLSARAVVEGIGSGRVYVTGGSDVSLAFEAAGGRRRAGIGDRLDVDPGAPVEMSLRVRGAPGTAVTLRSQGGIAKTVAISDADATINWSTRAGDIRYVRAEVRETNGQMVALTNPIWIVGRDASPIPRR